MTTQETIDEVQAEMSDQENSAEYLLKTIGEAASCETLEDLKANLELAQDVAESILAAIKEERKSLQ